MTDNPHPWDRRAAESDPAYEAFAAYLDVGSLRLSEQLRGVAR